MTDKPKEIKLELPKQQTDFFIQFKSKAIKRSQSEKVLEKLKEEQPVPPNSPVDDKIKITRNR